MHFRRSLGLALSLWFLLFAGTGGCQERRPQSAEQKPGVISVMLGKNVVIAVESNATTGYRWEIATPPDKKILDLVESEYKAPGSKLMGASGKQVFTFLTVGRGKTKVSLNYVRPWEKEAAPAKTQTFEVEVR